MTHTIQSEGLAYSPSQLLMTILSIGVANARDMEDDGLIKQLAATCATIDAKRVEQERQSS